MSATKFVVRGNAGALTQGAIGQNGVHGLAANAGEDISLNLQAAQVLSYVRVGRDLQLTLVNGEVITISGFFDVSGAPQADLYLSSHNDDDAPTPVDGGPAVAIIEGTQETGDLVTSEDYDDGIIISGTGTPNAPGTVTIGDVTQEIVVGPDGNWTADFGPDDILPGDYDVDVIVTITTDEGTTTDIGTVVVDTVTDVTFDPDSVTGDGHVSSDDIDDGVTLEGTTEPGSTVVVNVDRVDYPAVVDGGTWTVVIPADAIDPSDTALDVVVVSTDPVGNTDTVTGTVPVDTQTTVTIDTTGAGGDGTVNEVEHPDGVTVNGVAEPGSSVAVTLGETTQTVSIGDDGTWQVTFPSGVVPTGTLEVPVTAVSTDPFGNSASASGTVLIDTEIDLAIDDQAEGIVNAVERADGIALTGSADAGSSVVVEFAGVVHTTTADNAGQWTVDVAAADIPEGEVNVPVDVTATDPAGNIAMASSVVEIDTTIMVSVNTDDIAGDGTINAEERSDGIAITGQTQADAAVTVDFDGVQQTVTADADGGWSADFAAEDVPEGQLLAPISVTATDGAGNTATVTDTVVVDTTLGLAIDFDGIAEDGTINAVERDGGVEISGTTDTGAFVTVNFGAVTQTVQADNAGAWSVDIATADIPQGETTVAISATAVDAAGNTAATSGTVLVDTVVDPLASDDAPVEGDDMVNIAEAADGITLNGTVEAGATVDVTFQGVTRAATVSDSGDWTVTFAGSEVPEGTYAANVTIQATDIAGNTSTISDTFNVDTVAPEAPNIESFVKGEGGLRGFGIEDKGDAITASEFVEGGDIATPVDLGSGGFENPTTGEMNFGFADGHEVPNGAHLVVTAADTAGNDNSTFFVLDDSTGASAVDITAGALDGFNVGAIDLELFAEEANITISAEDIAALTGSDNALIINGKSDDTVVLDGSAQATGSQVIDGHDYTVYDIDAGAAQLIIRDDISFNQSVV